MGFDVRDVGAADIKDCCTEGIVDLYLTRYWGLKLATNAVTTILRVDQVSCCQFVLLLLYIVCLFTDNNGQTCRRA